MRMTWRLTLICMICAAFALGFASLVNRPGNNSMAGRAGSPACDEWSNPDCGSSVISGDFWRAAR